MSRKRIILLGGVAASMWLISGCATSPQLDLTSLPAETVQDDGVDYYSADIGADELITFGDDQWTTDEEGNRVYYLNRLQVGNGEMYYVGDIRYRPIDPNSNSNGRSTLGNAPVYVTRPGSSQLKQPTFRGSRNDTFYQTRRGRITYLPGRQSGQAAPDQSNLDQSNSEQLNPGQSDPAEPNSGPSDSRRNRNETSPTAPAVNRPRTRPTRAAPPRPSRSTPAPRPERRSQPRDDSPRRIDR